jgi:hypothetical protein
MTLSASSAATVGGTEPDPFALLGLLAEEARLRAFAAVLLGEGSSEAVGQRARLSTKDALRALTRLEAGGLLGRTGDGRWVAHPEVLRQAAVAAAPHRRYVDHGAADAEEAAVLRAFLPQGRLVQIPAQRSKRRVVLDHVCRAFEPGVRYPEQDVNALLRAFYADYAALRRYLVDEGFLSREAGIYWRSGGTVDVNTEDVNTEDMDTEDMNVDMAEADD